MRNRQYKKLYQESLLRENGLIDKLNTFNPSFGTSFKRKIYSQMLVAKDLATCCNRYVWDRLPINLTSQQLESLFYRFGSLCFYVDKGHLMISPYALQGQLQPYGRLEKIIPIDLAGKMHKTALSVIDINGGNTPTDSNVAVVINDYTADYQDILQAPRALINRETTIADEVEVYRQLHNNVKLSLKKALALCDNDKQRNQIQRQVENFFLSDNPIQAVSRSDYDNRLSDMPVEMWGFDNDFNTQNYCQTISFYDKERRSFNGIPSPDTFEKKERMITDEAENANVHTDLMLQDGYLQRLNGLLLVKKYIKAEGVESIEVNIADVLKGNNTVDVGKKDDENKKDDKKNEVINNDNR